MALQLHVNGEASIWTDIPGTLTELGVSVDGVTIDLTVATEDVQVDTYGPAAYDVQLFPEEARVTCELVLYDQTALQTVLARLKGGSTFGQMQAGGDLVIQQSFFFRLLVKSTGGTSENCWNFPKSYLHATDSFKIGTRKTVHRLEFRSLPAQQTGTASGAVLYNTTCT